jgi:hypothetical protein
LVVPIGPPDQRTPDDQGDLHHVQLPKFKATFKSKPPGAKAEDYFLEAYFDKDLGGEFWKGRPVTGTPKKFG